MDSRIYIKEQRQPERNAHGQVRDNWRPEMLHAGPPAFDSDKEPKHKRRDEHIHAEEAADVIGEELLDEEPHVEAMLAKKGNEIP